MVEKWFPSKAKTNSVLPRKCTGHNKHPLPTTQEKTLYMDIKQYFIGLYYSINLIRVTE